MFFKRRPREETVAEPETPAPQPPVEAAEEPQAVLRGELDLYHPWYLELRLREELGRATRTESVFSLAAWRMRLLPGQSLHPELLRRAAALITSNLRTYDVAAHIDGEHILALLFDADYHDAATVTFRIKADLQIRMPAAGKWQAGVATFRRDGLDGDSLIQATLRHLEEDARGD